MSSSTSGSSTPAHDAPGVDPVEDRWVRPGRTLALVLIPAAVLVPVMSAVFWRIAVATESFEEHQLWFQLWSIFDIGDEHNVAVWYNSTLWLLLGAVAIAAALTAPRHRLSWWFFAAVSITASADEAAELHERLIFVGDWLRPYVPVDVHYSWVIPGTAIAIVVALVLLRLVLKLRRPAMIGILAGGAIFLLGALVIETITGLVHREAGYMSTLYTSLTYVEEFFEVLGITVAIIAAASLFLVQRQDGRLSVRFDGYRRDTGGVKK